MQEFLLPSGVLKLDCTNEGVGANQRLHLGNGEVREKSIVGKERQIRRKERTEEGNSMHSGRSEVTSNDSGVTQSDLLWAAGT